MDDIFIQMAAYRDPEMLPTIRDCLAKSHNPEKLHFCIAWQRNEEDEWDNVDEFKNDDRFHIIDIPYRYARGACWPRNLIQQRYNGETYTLQIDSHHRFVQHWDKKLVDMLKDLQAKGYARPAISTYAPQYDPLNGERNETVTEMIFDKFTEKGVVFFLPSRIQHPELLNGPIPAKFYSAHFCFTLGQFCREVPHDPYLYFHGEEISIAARAYTHGYDFFHPHICILFHEYTRKNRQKQWDDNRDWWKFDSYSLWRNRVLFGMEEGQIDFGEYGFGNNRTLQDYENYSGLNFKERTYSPNNSFDCSSST